MSAVYPRALGCIGWPSCYLYTHHHQHASAAAAHVARMAQGNEKGNTRFCLRCSHKLLVGKIRDMCGRYVSPDEAAIERAWHIGARNNNPFNRNFNAAPSTQVPLLCRDAESRELKVAAARWGMIPGWWKEAKLPVHTISARSEEAATKAMCPHPLRSARCLMPAEGWYEWQKIERVDPDPGEVREVQQPHFIYKKGNQPFCFAALMSMWTPPGKTDSLLSCALLTRAASQSVAAVHDCMPVVLPDAAHDAWLDPALTDAAKVMAIMHECAVDDFDQHAVSTQVNSPKNDDESLIHELV